MNLDRTFLKKLWNGEKVLCPKCNKEYLVPLHKKIKNKTIKMILNVLIVMKYIEQ